MISLNKSKCCLQFSFCQKWQFPENDNEYFLDFSKDQIIQSYAWLIFFQKITRCHLEVLFSNEFTLEDAETGNGLYFNEIEHQILKLYRIQLLTGDSTAGQLSLKYFV